MARPIIVGIAGGSASGKTSIACLIKERIETEIGIDTVLLSSDSFYKKLDDKELKLAFEN